VSQKKLSSRIKNIGHFFSSLKEVARHGYPARRLTVIGVTGTDGKTTTAHLIYQILKNDKKPVALISTIGAFFKDKQLDTGLHTTTPDAAFLQPLIKKAVKEGVRYLVLEATSHGLDQHRVLGYNFSVGVLTNVTHEHLDYHKTFEKYRRAKAKLFKGVKTAVLNKDDPSFSFFKNRLRPKARCLSYSLNRPASLRLISSRLSPWGTKLTIKSRRKKINLETKLIGRYNISNILAAVGAARGLGIGWESIKRAVADFNNVPGRMETINLGQSFSVIIDFAHTPNALEKMLRTLRKIKKEKGRVIVVFGCAGERDLLKRPMMGKVSTKLADVSFFTAEDPRHEKAEKIINQIVEGVIRGRRELTPEQILKKPTGRKIFVRQPDRRKAIYLAMRTAQPDDIVVICGKGHEKSMAYGDKEIPWSDQEVAKEALKKLSQSQP